MIGPIDFTLLRSPPDPWVIALCMAPLPLLVVRSPITVRTAWLAPSRAATVWLGWCLLSITWSIAPVITAGAAVATLGMWFTAIWFTASFGFAAFARTYTTTMAVYLTVGFIRDLTIVWTDNVVHRFGGFSLHPNNLSHVALFTTLLSLILIVEHRERALVRWWSLAIGIVTLVASGARTTLIAFALSMLLMAYRRLGAVRALAIGTIAAGAVAIVLSTVPDPGAVVTRDENARDLASINGRSTIWPIALDATFESPIVGNGLSSGQVVFPMAKQRGELPFPDIEHAHNLWLEQAMSTGLVGVALLAASFVSYFTSRPRATRGMSGVLIVALLVVGMTEPVLSWRTSSYLVMAALFAERAVSNRRHREEDGRRPAAERSESELATP